jgi:hypothetical protein
VFKVPEKYRITKGELGTTAADGNNGIFLVPNMNGKKFFVIASDGYFWEHVSVSLKKKICPTWNEMCFLKALFWGPDDLVIQYHPPKQNYVNMHPYVLHLWRPVDQIIPMPEAYLV